MVAVLLFDGGLGSFGVVVLIVAMEMVVGILLIPEFLLPILVYVICGLVGCSGDMVYLVGAKVDSSLIRSHRRLVGRLDV